MANIFIIHGVQGSPQENWFPWLKAQLEKLDHQVFVPQFPTPENQTLEHWMKVMDQYRQHITKETILIGHSLGGAFVLNLLEKYPVQAAFFIGSVFGKVENEFDESMKTFAQKAFDWAKIKAHCHAFIVMHSDNDPYIRLEKAHELAAHLGTEVTLVKGAGHFNTAAGYGSFDLLFDTIKNEYLP